MDSRCIFPSNAGITLVSNSLGAGWLNRASCTGSSCSAQVAGGRGYYYDGTSNNSCCGTVTANDNNPANNWGLSTISCTTPFTITFRLNIQNYTLSGSPTILKLRGSADGATGCWSTPDATTNSIQFQFPTIACAPPPTTLCNPAGMITYSAATGGSSYQWQVSTDSVNFSNISDNANYANTNTNAVTLSNIPSSWYGREYRCFISGTQYSPVFILKFQSAWTGAVSTDWNTAGNWSCGTVPDAYTDAIINSGTVNVTADCSVRSVTTGTGVLFTVNPGVLFTVLH